MLPEAFAVIDSGTTGTRCSIYDDDLNVIGYYYIKNKLIYPVPGWVEQDPHSIIRNSIIAFKKALENSKKEVGNIKGIGITNQRETVIGWDKSSGNPIYNAIVWQDNRTSRMAEEFSDNHLDNIVREKTGLYIKPYFSALKIKWLLEKKLLDSKKMENIIFGTVDSWLIWNLTKGKHLVSDYTNASRTMLMNIHKLEWDKELLDYFGLNETNLPEISPSFGGPPIELDRLGKIPLLSVLGDQQSALLGERCLKVGDTKVTVGTGTFILQNIGQNSEVRKDGILTTIAYGTPGKKTVYALEGSTQISGGLLDWLVRNGIVKNLLESEIILEEEIDKGWNENIYFVPSFSGLYSPYWDSKSRGTIIGISGFTNRRSFVIAAYESIVFQIMDIVKAMGTHHNKIKIDGGLSRNYTLMQMISDYMGVEILVSDKQEVTSLGTALAANSGRRGMDNEIPDDLGQRYKKFSPHEKDVNSRYLKWKDAVQRSLSWEV